MNPGTMRHVITIWSRGDEQRKNGFFGQERQKICVIRARRADATSREAWEAYAAKVTSVVNFTIRPCALIKKGMWVECEGQWHEIVGIQRGTGISLAWTLKTICKEAI